MTDVKFDIKYKVDESAMVPSPKAILTMQVKADENGHVPVSVRSMNGVLGEHMHKRWGNLNQTSGWRVKEVSIEGGTWPAVQAKVEENILAVLACMQEADERYHRLVAEQPADYVYDTTVPGPATPEPATPPADEEEEREERFVDNRPWAMAEFGLSELPCSAAANFLAKHFDDIVRFGERERSEKWHQLYTIDRFSLGIKWLEALVEADDEAAYPIHDWIEWARDHWA